MWRALRPRWPGSPTAASEELAERLCVRPTSETLFCEHYANIIHSYRDLPKLYNQWCSRGALGKDHPSLPAHHGISTGRRATPCTRPPQEAMAETERMLNVYADFCEETLAIPVIKGRKTDKEKFAGAEATYTIEAMMHDGKALQSGTSHYFGDGFATRLRHHSSPTGKTSCSIPTRPPGACPPASSAPSS